MEGVCETTSSSLPHAIISRSALSAAASAAVRAGGTVADLRRDAWGHGVLAVAQAVVAAGAGSVLVDAPGEVEALRLEGITAVTTGRPDMDSSVLYGLPDESGVVATRPVMRLTGHVMSIKRLQPGDAVSYGYTFRAAEETSVALVTGGYAQGIARALGNKAAVEIDGVAMPIVGRVAMDVCVVDVGNSDTQIGAEATYFGGEGPAMAGLSRWAAVTGMKPAELITVAGTHAVRRWES